MDSKPTWLGKTILHPDDAQRLETDAAVNEFQYHLPRQEAEDKAYNDYLRKSRVVAAAHHLGGLQAAVAVGNHEDARKHWALFDMHMKTLGHNSIGPVPAEVESVFKAPEKHVYRFKTHPADITVIGQEPEPEITAIPVTKAEGAKRCKWRLGERRCQRMVKADYCHDHVDHWANKISQKDHDSLEKAWPKDDAENQANSLAFMSGTEHAPMALDQLLESWGGTKTSPSTGATQEPSGPTVHELREPKLPALPKNPFTVTLHDENTADGDEAPYSYTLHAQDMRQARAAAAAHHENANETPPIAFVPEETFAGTPASRGLSWRTNDLRVPAPRKTGSNVFARGPSERPIYAAAKAELPPVGTAHLTPPKLHSDVNSFMTHLKGLPKEGPDRGKFITSHMNHGPFIAALQAHPQGKAVHATLTNFLNSKANAGPGGSTQIVAKAEILKAVLEGAKRALSKLPEPLMKPPVSEAQRRAMYAAASGNSTLGIPKKVGKEFASADSGKKLPEKK